MISMTKNRLGVLPYPIVGYVGSGAMAASDGGAGASWLHQRVSQDQSVSMARTVHPIPTVNATRLSAPPERSP